MIARALILGLVGLAAASSASPDAEAVPLYPETSKSDAFRLVVNVTEAPDEFLQSIHNTYITSIHIGPGLALVGNVGSSSRGRIFYQNGTADEHRDKKSTIITDSGTPSFSSGMTLVQDWASDWAYTARLDAGPGTPGVGLAPLPAPLVTLYPETWVACNQSLTYYQNKRFVVFKRAEPSTNIDGSINRNIPPFCYPVRLLPECTGLNDLAPGSYANHSFVLKDRCYEDVRRIKWDQYRL